MTSLIQSPDDRFIEQLDFSRMEELSKCKTKLEYKLTFSKYMTMILASGMSAERKHIEWWRLAGKLRLYI